MHMAVNAPQLRHSGLIKGSVDGPECGRGVLARQRKNVVSGQHVSVRISQGACERLVEPRAIDRVAGKIRLVRAAIIIGGLPVIFLSNFALEPGHNPVGVRLGIENPVSRINEAGAESRRAGAVRA